MIGSQLKRLAESPAAFRAGLLVETDRGPRLLAEVADAWQVKDFEALDPAWRRVAGHPVGEACQRAYLERPRGHSKTADIATMAAWVLFASRRKLAGVVAAADRGQAGLIRDAIERLVRLNPWLREYLDVQRERVVNPHTGSELAILSSDAPTSYGLTPDFVICDELTHWQKRDLWDSLLSAAAKRASCLLLIISNAGYGESWQWDTREAIRTDDDWYFSRLDGPRASWISEKLLAEQRRLLPAIAFRRLWLNEWTAGSGDALDEDAIAVAVTLPGPLKAAEPGWIYLAALDIGLTRDATAIAVIGKHVGHVERIARPARRRKLAGPLAAMAELGMIDGLPADEEQTEYRELPGSGRLKLAALRVWQPTASQRVSLEAVERSLLRLNERYRLASVAFDPWQAAYLVERLRAQGIATTAVDFVPANLKSMASAVLEAFGERQIDLFDEPRLLADLRALRVEEKSYGFRLVSPRGPSGHGDAATALSIGLHAAGEVRSPASSTVEGPLVCWP